jgi:hypothetical protein
MTNGALNWRKDGRNVGATAESGDPAATPLGSFEGVAFISQRCIRRYEYIYLVTFDMCSSRLSLPDSPTHYTEMSLRLKCFPSTGVPENMFPRRLDRVEVFATNV